MAEYKKPLPKPTADSAGFWEGCKRHELVIQQCTDCGKYRHYPQPMCPACHSMNREWSRVSGKGKIYTYVRCPQAFHPGWADEAPYGVVTVELDEGVRMVSNMVDVKPEDLEIGMPVEVVFEDVTDEVTLPKFKLAR